MKYVIDLGTFSWHQAACIQYGHKDRWVDSDLLVEGGAILCDDSGYSLRRQHYPWYKSNRDNLPKVTTDLQKIAKAWVKAAKKRYGNAVQMMRGLEADDLCAMFAKPGDIIISRDKDLLQLRDAYLVDSKLVHWTIARQQAKTKLPLEQGERWLTYQLLHGDNTDCIPRSIFSKDRYTAPWAFQQPSPLRAALLLLPEVIACQSLNTLMLPTPLWECIDPIQRALEIYPDEQSN